MIGPGKQVLSVEASTELLLRVEQAVDSERQSELRFRELPQSGLTRSMAIDTDLDTSRLPRSLRASLFSA